MNDLGNKNLTMKQVCSLLKVNRMTITSWVKSKTGFPIPFKIGRKNLWDKEEILEYIEKIRELGK